MTIWWVDKSEGTFVSGCEGERRAGEEEEREDTDSQVDKPTARRTARRIGRPTARQWEGAGEGGRE